MHLNSKLLFKKYAGPLFKPNISVLEIGPDKHPSSYHEIVAIETIKWQTLNIMPDPHLTYTSNNEYSYPIADECFDIVLAGQVVEHVRKPWIWIKELARICKAGGHIIILNPISWTHHEYPIDCWRIYPDGMKGLFEETGIKVILSKFECLEPPCLFKLVPGVGIVDERSVVSILKKVIRWPFTYPLDTITIGVKEQG